MAIYPWPGEQVAHSFDHSTLPGAIPENLDDLVTQQSTPSLLPIGLDDFSCLYQDLGDKFM